MYSTVYEIVQHVIVCLHRDLAILLLTQKVTYIYIHLFDVILAGSLLCFIDTCVMLEKYCHRDEDVFFLSVTALTVHVTVEIEVMV